MLPENSSFEIIWYGPYEGFEIRRQHRLQQDLGIDQAVAETILHLRDQVIELQAHIRQLEAERQIQNTTHQMRLAPYQQTYTEAVWVEASFNDNSRQAGEWVV